MRSQTNQVAELYAVLCLLRAAPSHVPLLVRSDSQYAINVCTAWMAGWKRRGWVKADGTPVRNLGLVRELDRALSGRDAAVRFEWVKGHSGDPLNEAADGLCTRMSRLLKSDGVVGRTGPGWGGG